MTYFVEVAVFPHRVPITKRLPSAYTYLVPDDWPEVLPGSLVLVPFGRQDEFDRLVSGVIVKVTDEQPDVTRVKPLEAVLHTLPVVDPARLELAHWLSETYVEPLSNCVRLFAPPGQSIHSDIEYALVERDEIFPALSKSQAELIELLRLRGPLRAGQINAAFGQRDWKRPIERLIDQSWIAARRVLPDPRTRARRQKLVGLSSNSIDLSAATLGRSPETQQRRQAILAFL